jgi:tetratricopeptide (TPR) repeat protein
MPTYGQTIAEDWFNKGMNLSDQSKYRDALVAFDKAIELNPQYADAWRIKGALLNCLGKYDESLKAWNKVIEIDPQDAVAWTNKGFSLYGKSEYEEAANVFDMATQLDPRLAEARVGKGFALLEFVDFPFEPRDAFDHAIALDTNYGIAWIGAYLSGGSYNWGAVTSLNNAARLNPKCATDLFTEYGETLSFQREVFLKDSCAQNPGK